MIGLHMNINLIPMFLWHLPNSREKQGLVELAVFYFNFASMKMRALRIESNWMLTSLLVQFSAKCHASDRMMLSSLHVIAVGYFSLIVDVCLEEVIAGYYLLYFKNFSGLLTASCQQNDSLVAQILVIVSFASHDCLDPVKQIYD